MRRIFTYFREVKGRASIKTFSVLWNAMINPLLSMTIFGVLWYQGENNAGSKTSNYSCTFATMIASWRKNWHRKSLNTTNTNFPFGFVQVRIGLGIKIIYNFVFCFIILPVASKFI